MKTSFYSFFLGPIRPRAVRQGGAQGAVRERVNLSYKIDIVVMIIWSIVIIINFVLTASLSHDREPCEIKVVFNHTCSLHTCVCAGPRRRRVRLVAFDRGNCFTVGGFPSNPIPVRVCAEQHHSSFNIIQQLWSPTSRSDAIICRLDSVKNK